ncbi:hypothetical protein LHP98_16545 [Rhodobacter sp. Har01]|uniref:hypothetical protein n=1 Tax=Rhodobacter sp. Har01 TaxID=2883999 RepID=UPI001D08BA52|nr:hypothetical protein [Rhodobacter sp. Har01]MCB6179732.1 hypothetical protein [Rhodobacter sp. Har01]
MAWSPPRSATATTPARWQPSCGAAAKRRAELAQGVPVDDAVWQKLAALAEAAGVPLP